MHTVQVMSHSELLRELQKEGVGRSFNDSKIKVIFITDDQHDRRKDALDRAPTLNLADQWIDPDFDICLSFDDVESSTEFGTQFSWKMADQILCHLVAPYRDKLDLPDIIVSCPGGVSRSAAIGAFLVEANLAEPRGIFDGTDDPFFGPDFAPNSLVFVRLRDVFLKRYASRIDDTTRKRLNDARGLFALNALFHQEN